MTTAKTAAFSSPLSSSTSERSETIFFIPLIGLRRSRLILKGSPVMVQPTCQTITATARMATSPPRGSQVRK